MTNTKQTLKEWVTENSAEIIAEVNSKLQTGKDWSGETYTRKGSTKRECYSEANRVLGYKVEDLLNSLGLKYDGLPLVFSKKYDRTRSGVQANRRFDFEVKISIGEHYDEDYEEVKEMFFDVTEVAFSVDVKLTKVSSYNQYLVKSIEVTSTDLTLSELVNKDVEYEIGKHKLTQQNLDRAVEECKAELNKHLEQLENGIYESSWSLNRRTEEVERASELAQEAIKFFETIEKIKSGEIFNN